MHWTNRMSIDICSMSAAKIAHCISMGELTAEAVMVSYLDRINARDDVVKSFIDFDADRALSLARASDQHDNKGILRGVPFAIKDIFDTIDLPTSWGSPIYSGFQPPRNASCVELLIRAGAIPIGQPVTT